MTVANRIRLFFHPNQAQVQEPPITPATALEERQALLAHHVRLVVKRMTNGLCIYGQRGGLGKSKVVIETLRAEGVQPVMRGGHCTPLALYTTLFHNPDKIIFLDDCDSLFRNLPALGLLRSALWGQNNSRLVTYNSSQIRIPQKFYFSGRIIFTLNTLPQKNHAFSAVVSRVDQFQLDASNGEVVEMMRELARRGYEDKLSPDECDEVVSFIEEFSATRMISLRLLEPSYRKKIYARDNGVDWRDLVRSQLEEIGKDDADKSLDTRANAAACIRQVIESHPNSVADQIEMFRNMTGKSRATFFRLKKGIQPEEANRE